MQTLFDALGGSEGIGRIVNTFYGKVKNDPLLSPIFPEDLTETARKQYMFLCQFFGGPPLYSEEFGSPMLRARHIRFPITPSRAERWLKLMSEAFDEEGVDPLTKELAFLRLTKTAHHMTNTPEPEAHEPHSTPSPSTLTNAPSNAVRTFKTLNFLGERSSAGNDRNG
ncbi:MAG: globin [Candidatus Carbobacillus altaicus]|nr:globin [Candidatus Carbobacillus altaicus]